MITVDKKMVPLPIKKRNSFPWDALKKTGDSFHVQYSDNSERKKYHTASNILSAFNLYRMYHNLPWKITTRKMDGGVRVWRIDKP